MRSSLLGGVVAALIFITSVLSLSANGVETADDSSSSAGSYVEDFASTNGEVEEAWRLFLEIDEATGDITFNPQINTTSFRLFTTRHDVLAFSALPPTGCTSMRSLKLVYSNDTADLSWQSVGIGIYFELNKVSVAASAESPVNVELKSVNSSLTYTKTGGGGDLETEIVKESPGFKTTRAPGNPDSTYSYVDVSALLAEFQSEFGGNCLLYFIFSGNDYRLPKASSSQSPNISAAQTDSRNKYYIYIGGALLIIILILVAILIGVCVYRRRRLLSRRAKAACQSTLTVDPIVVADAARPPPGADAAEVREQKPPPDFTTEVGRDVVESPAKDVKVVAESSLKV